MAGVPSERRALIPRRPGSSAIHKENHVNTVFETAAFEEIVRIRAYGIWESEGCPHGRDVEHWFLSLEETRRFAEAKMAEQPETAANKPRAKKAVKAPAATRRSGAAIRVSPTH
jgi:hypothetical protein